MDKARAEDKKYLDIYRAFYENYKRTEEPEVRHAFADTLGRLKERCIAGASEEALKIAKQKGMELPRAKPWHNPFVNLLICEHNLPKKQVTDMVLEMPQWDDRKAMDIIGKSRCYWISKGENDTLSKHGYRNRRNETTYTEIGIVIQPFKETAGSLLS